jgi:predicted ATP-dependent Lon-type protease
VGLEIFEKQLQDRTVRTGEEELFKARAKEQGSIKLIDIVKAKLDTKKRLLYRGASKSRSSRRSYW